jgi:hypothetical protein
MLGKEDQHLVNVLKQLYKDSLNLRLMKKLKKRNNNLLKVTDLLGRETKGTKNAVLFYIYDDGTVEKRIVVE